MGFSRPEDGAADVFLAQLRPAHASIKTIAIPIAAPNPGGHRPRRESPLHPLPMRCSTSIKAGMSRKGPDLNGDDPTTYER